MKNFNFRFLMLVLVVNMSGLIAEVCASPISLQQVQNSVQSFIKQRGGSLTASSLHRVQVGTSRTAELQPYYVFNIDDANGFVIASGDDSTPAILGYSDEGRFDAEDIPDNVQWWLDEYARQIKFLQDHGAPAARFPRVTSNHSSIAPKLTSKWGQYEPYNTYCPIIDEEHCSTGSVATALAQVMYYHRARSVKQTVREIPAYTTWTKHFSIDAIPAGSAFDWDNMVDEYNNTSTEAQKQAVARLMQYCGAAVQTDYDLNESYASMLELQLTKYFKYSSKVNSKWRSGYSDAEWDEMVYTELKSNRPVLYSGYNDKSESHAFVCDGYDENGFYHINWGWGGLCDGYFLLTVNDSGNDMLSYPYSQCAVFNVSTNQSQTPVDEIQFADFNVEFKCLIRWDTNDDAALSKEEAAAVTEIAPNAFSWSFDMTTFDELEFFTGLKSIGDGAFYDCANLTSITLPNSLISIGKEAFASCRLTSITLPNSVTTIGEAAFQYGGSFNDITIPESVTSIGRSAFNGCNITSLTWNAKNCSSNGNMQTRNIERVTIGDEVVVLPDYFVNSSKITKVNIPQSVTTIGNWAFNGCSGLSSITIPDSVARIGGNAFAGCVNLTDIDIPDAVNYIGEEAFANDINLVSVTIGKSVSEIRYSVFEGCNIKNLTWNARNCSSNGDMPTRNIERVTIGDEVVVLPDYFVKGSKITTVNIPQSVTTIGSQTFRDCSGLTNVNIPNSVTHIGGEAFFGCSGLTSITIPGSVTSIDGSAFCDCNGLDTVTCLALCPPVIYWSAFSSDCKKNALLRVPVTAIQDYKSASDWMWFKHIVGISLYVGDVNCDFEINLADINTLIDVISRNGNVYEEAYDVNNDNEVGLADINALIDIILSE
jgi:hypothetical protein